jgi:uncharacterized membrane-anchored protein YjiN (DUF445 family)
VVAVGGGVLVGGAGVSVASAARAGGVADWHAVSAKPENNHMKQARFMKGHADLIMKNRCA